MSRIQFSILAIFFALAVKYVLQFLLNQEVFHEELLTAMGLFSEIKFGVFGSFEFEASQEKKIVNLSNTISLVFTAIVLSVSVYFVPLGQKQDNEKLNKINNIQVSSLAFGWFMFVFTAFWVHPYFEVSDSSERFGALSEIVHLIHTALGDFWLLINVLLLVLASVSLDVLWSVVRNRRYS